MVHSLKSEYEGRIRFITTNINTPEGRGFAQIYNVSNVTLLFFAPDGNLLAPPLSGVQEVEFLRETFDRVFKF